MDSQQKRNNDHNITRMTFASIYPLYLNKAEKKGRTKDELDEVIEWLTGFNSETIQTHIDNGHTLHAFFNEARINNKATLIKGVICGKRIEDIEDPFIKNVRYLDKLVDELAKGWPIENILRKNI